MSLVFAVPSPMTRSFHRTRKCAGRGGTWPALGMSERAAREHYDLTPCGNCLGGRAQ